MVQPRGWWLESGWKQSDLKELANITRPLLLYATFFTTTATCNNFIDFVHVNYQNKNYYRESLVARSLNLSNNTYKSEYLFGSFISRSYT